VAETFTAVVALTDFVVTVKVALVLPAGTVTLPGMEATAEAPLAIASETTAFWLTAAGNVTLPVVVPPPASDVGEKLNPDGVMALTVKNAVFVTPFRVAEILAFTGAVSWLVWIVQLAELRPAGTITDVGIDAIAEVPLSTATLTAVLLCTGAVSVTFPVAFKPPRTGLGETETEEAWGGSRVIVAPVLNIPSFAVIFTFVVLVTGLVDCVNVATWPPAGISTGPGLTDGLLLERLTVIPLAGARPTSPNLPVVDLDPGNEAGE
jgi:hypothetical protein